MNKVTLTLEDFDAAIGQFIDELGSKLADSSTDPAEYRRLQAEFDAYPERRVELTVKMSALTARHCGSSVAYTLTDKRQDCTAAATKRRRPRLRETR